jgi:hypothetical protein
VNRAPEHIAELLNIVFACSPLHRVGAGLLLRVLLLLRKLLLLGELLLLRRRELGLRGHELVLELLEFRFRAIAETRLRLDGARHVGLHLLVLLLHLSVLLLHLLELRLLLGFLPPTQSRASAMLPIPRMARYMSL